MAETTAVHATMTASAARQVLRLSLPLCAAALVLASGCARRDSVTVGSVPDDYRTNHPILIAEKEQNLDLPVGASDRGMTRGQKVAIEGFLYGYDRSAAPVVRVMVPSGSANHVAASEASSDFVRVLRSNGVPEGRIAVISYQAGSPELSPPVRLSFSAMRAQTGKCGRWPEDLLNTVENKHYADFGCSSQNNLAAQIANPEDLLGPRKPSPVDADNRSDAIDQYQARAISGEFIDTSEVSY
ncbi:CpaD family pilus assembly protein [Mesorhizobium sp. L-8-3]|uniref:CpaD family pilus assembly protein n=1 Tax=Mesorhizobium sp. L-8-3 TaxID=2744522 RepID=UPI001928C0CB|nr:CpaD family pilus assembly protein [Mesorhizobium sp. L-8-3]BCH28058.1 pilus biogenesis lipoprotein CpaD [Mesorhizobium sp. L-8-3]